ncbi:threonine/serine exporter [Caloramator sp. E03]|uniref:threonine/serine exporter family protein n=1 Tax=Caloramator sp. E03 TaxID=2576307 RepID=UPI001110F581|nr:threonine/serine exporter family protein [Caloramator sp. E03]QCX33318.1 threonine/serine exporter [Caloramator sp. E03]
MRDFLFAFLGSFCGGIIFNIQKKNLVWAGVCGGLSWITYISIYKYTNGVVFSTFIGAIVVGFYSETMARILKTPAFVFSIPGIFPLVPGAGAYFTVLYLVNNNYSSAAVKAVETVAIAGAIAFGILFTTTLFQFAYKIIERYKHI